MESRTIFSNEYLTIYENSKEIFIETYKKGFPIDELYNIMSSHPEIGLKSFKELRDSIFNAPKPPTKIGELKEPISVKISDNKMAAYLVFNLPPEQLKMENRDALIKSVMKLLEEKRIVHGIKHDILKGELVNGKQYTIAEGTPPVNGRDAVVKMYELADPKPVVGEYGKVDFYELKLINRVNIGDWLGERIEATEGIPGLTVTGEAVKPVKGRNIPLNYDKNSVHEIQLGSKTVLYSKINGAVNYSDGRISVSNHLEIDGDVNPATGNIKFDGYVTINGTVMEGFTVEVTKDIEIKGDLGISNVKSIISTGGSIFLKGGISSKKGSEIRAAKNIYAKYIDNAIVSCGGTLHIGYYCKDSVVNAREVIVDSTNGQIFGGQINVDVRIYTPILGSEIERKTVIEVRGFNRSVMESQLEHISDRINELRKEQQNLKQSLLAYKLDSQIDEIKYKEYERLLEKAYSIKEELKSLEEERKNIASYLKAKGEGEISIGKRVFPNCTLIIKKNIIEVTSPLLATTYFIQNGSVKQI
ncbi:MAG TPA: DUF342 domain-containing protein [Clostridiaceae bacterium]|nr:DUF342 domain-containing protein [Clostridiaceae bacterium]